MIASTMKNSVKVLKKFQSRPILLSSYSTSGYLSGKKKRKNLTKGMCSLMFITELFAITKIWKQSKCPWMNK